MCPLRQTGYCEQRGHCANDAVVLRQTDGEKNRRAHDIGEETKAGEIIPEKKFLTRTR